MQGSVEWRDVVGPANESRIRAMFGWSRCSQSGSTVENMFERCPFEAACLGAPNLELEGKFEGGVAMRDSPEGCNEAYRNDSSNFLCSACAPGFSHTAGDTSGKCDKCPRPGENEGIAALGIMLGILGIIAYIKLTLSGGGKKDASDGVKSIGCRLCRSFRCSRRFPSPGRPYSRRCSRSAGR